MKATPEQKQQIMTSVNRGADLVTENIAPELEEVYNNAANVIVCAIGSVLDDPDITFEQMMTDNFGPTADQWHAEFPSFVPEDEADAPSASGGIVLPEA